MGDWKFISFVKTAFLAESLPKLNSMSSHIVILALHREIMKYRLLVLEKDPWYPRDRNGKQKAIKISVISTFEINLPPRPIEHLKSIHLLSKGRDTSFEVGGALIF